METEQAAAVDTVSPEEQRAIVRTAVNQVATARGLAAPWPDETALPEWVMPEPSWGAAELGLMREQLLATDARNEGGVWYTPPEVAEAMVRMSIGPQLDRLSQHPDPGNVLQVLALDPACGGGVFLIEAARLISVRYAARLAEAAGCQPTVALARFVLPEVIDECIFGVDLDPSAVDLAKSVLWLEAGGAFPIAALGDHIVCGNTLDLALPPAFEKRRLMRDRERTANARAVKREVADEKYERFIELRRTWTVAEVAFDLGLSLRQAQRYEARWKAEAEERSDELVAGEERPAG